jgi:hypothetical protein
MQILLTNADRTVGAPQCQPTALACREKLRLPGAIR